MELRQDREPTVFNSRLLLLFVGIFLYMALLYRQNELSLLAMLILIVMGGARAWTCMSATRIRCASVIDNVRVFPDEIITLATTVENGKWLPVWFHVIWSFDGALKPVTAGDRICRQHAAALWHQTVRFQQTFVALRRGVYQVGPPLIRTSDFLGFFEKEASTPDANHIIVYPRLVPLRPFPIRRRDLFGVPGANSPVKDPVYIFGTCDYQPCRPSRHIHWKASARHLRLQEKIFEPSEQEKVLLTLDVEPFGENNREDNFEHALEVLASLAVQLDRKGYALGFASNGVLKGGHSALIQLGHGPRQIPAILETLARIQAKPVGNMTTIIRQFLGAQRGISCVHFCCEDGPSVTAMEKLFQKRQIPISLLMCQRTRDIQPSGVTHHYSIDEIRMGGSLHHESR